MPPKIDRKAMVDIKVRAGLNFDFDVHVDGEPPASKEWSVKDNILLPSERVKITNEDYNTRLRITDARRADSGEYKLVAKNINGKDTATVFVTVLDVPTAPEGPLKASDITKNSMQLSWRAPRDDGGSEILHYIVEKMDSEALRWVPVGDTSMTQIKADHLIENHNYMFRVRAVNRQGESPNLMGLEPITAKDPFGKPEKPGTPEVTGECLVFFSHIAAGSLANFA